jgi:hypothetical protein
MFSTTVHEEAGIDVCVKDCHRFGVVGVDAVFVDRFGGERMKEDDASYDESDLCGLPSLGSFRGLVLIISLLVTYKDSIILFR